jgi:hypothetical protein
VTGGSPPSLSKLPDRGVSGTSSCTDEKGPSLEGQFQDREGA